MVNGHLNPLTTTVWPPFNTQNNKRNFSLPSYHLNEIHECFIWLFNNVDSYAFFIMYNTYALFRHCSISDQWLLCTEIWVEAIIAGQRSRWKRQLNVRVSLHFHLGDLHFFGSHSSLETGLFAPKAGGTARHTYCLKPVDHPTVPSNWLVGSCFFFKEELSFL